MKKVMTVVLVRRGNELLLGLKKRGYTEGRWNGFGGKVHEGETVRGCAARELFEEAGISSERLIPIGVGTFSFTGTDDVHEVHYFAVDSWGGEPAESEEMLPQWFTLEAIPYDLMWPDVRLWMPFYLDGKRFIAEGRYDGTDTLLTNSVRVDGDIAEL